MYRFEQILSFRENIKFLILVGHPLIEHISFCAMIHLLHHFPFSVDLIICSFLIDVALEMILMVRLPGLRAHVAKIFTAFACHEVAAHRPLDRLLARGADLCVLGDPFSISLLFYDLFDPSALLVAAARVVVVTLAEKAEDFAAVAFDCVLGTVYFYAIAAVRPRAELIVAVCCYEQFANLFLIFFQEINSFFSIVLQKMDYCFQKNWLVALVVHTAREDRSCKYAIFHMVHPALNAKAMPANIGVQCDVLNKANLAYATTGTLLIGGPGQLQ